jgi:hypothetical protein
MSSQRVTLAWITPVTTNTFWSLHSRLAFLSHTTGRTLNCCITHGTIGAGRGVLQLYMQVF